MKGCRFHKEGYCSLSGVTCEPSPICGYVARDVKVKFVSEIYG